MRRVGLKEGVIKSITRHVPLSTIIYDRTRPSYVRIEFNLTNVNNLAIRLYET